MPANAPPRRTVVSDRQHSSLLSGFTGHCWTRGGYTTIRSLLQHKKAGNPVAAWRDGKVILIKPEDIVVEKK